MTPIRNSLPLLLALAMPAAAQDLLQADDAWFTAGRATIEARLADAPITGRAKNVILFVADGNGIGTNYAIRLHMGQAAGGLGDDFVLPYEAFPYAALVKTYSTNGQTPDSAPTASAMNSGIKTKNDLINVTDAVAVGDCAAGLANKVTTFADIASAAGKSVGIVSTARITHATPAAVYANSAHRDWEDDTGIPEGCAQPDIAVQLLDKMMSGVIDLAMGGGRQHFLPAGITDVEGKEGKRADGRNLIDEATAAGAQVVQNDADFMALTAPGNAPILGLFEASHMMYDHDRTGEPSLAQMTETAIKALSGNEAGYYLSIESGRVDHASHAGNLYRTVTDGAAFAAAVSRAMELTNVEDTLIIVTSDHEHALAFNGYCGRGSDVTGLCMGIDEAGNKHTGSPSMADDGKPYTVANFLNGPGSTMIEQADKSFSATRAADLTNDQAMDPDYIQQALIPLGSETHSGEDVAAYARGPWAHLLGGVIEQNVIFHVMNHAITAE